jgi:hypothetical protein
MPLRQALVAALLLTLLSARPCLAGPAFGGEVCSFATNSTNKPPGACSLTSNVPAGATVVVLAVQDENDYHVTNVTDTQGNKIFLCMMQLLFLLRNARSLHPHARKTARAVEKQRFVAVSVEPEEELVGVGH